MASSLIKKSRVRGQDKSVIVHIHLSLLSISIQPNILGDEII